MKRAFKITFFITLSLILLFAISVCVSSILFEKIHAGSIGIIGGADGPTVVFLSRSFIFDNPIFWIFFVVAALCAASAIGWIMARKK